MSPDTSPESDGRSSLGAQLRAERVAAGLTQTQAAKRARIARGTLLRWEQDEQPPRADLLERLRVVYADAANDVSRDTLGVADDAGDVIPLSREMIGEVRATLRVTTLWLRSIEQQMAANVGSARAAADTLEALRRSLDQATNGVAQLLTGDLSPDAAARMDEVDRLVDAEAARELTRGADRNTTPPSTQRASGA